MIDASDVSNARVFAAYAQNRADVWQLAIGQRVAHTGFGEGTVKSLETRSGNIYLEVSFFGDAIPTRKFNSDAFATAQYFYDMHLPAGLPEIEEVRERLREQHRLEEQRRIEREKRLAQEQQRQEEERQRRELEQQQIAEQEERERAATQEFAELKAKYLAQNYKDRSPSSPLYVILLRIEAGEALDEAQVTWLKRHKLSGTLALYFQNEYRISKDAWALVKASGYWRDADQPEKAIILTNYLLEKQPLNDARVKSAVFTTRGGAFRDLRDLALAEQCAEDAIRHNETSFQPYNLLGAVYFERGEAEKGEACFSRAVELGAQLHNQESQMQNALDNAGHLEQAAVAEYLLQRDPNRYKWAEYYLQE